MNYREAINTEVRYPSGRVSYFENYVCVFFFFIISFFFLFFFSFLVGGCVGSLSLAFFAGANVIGSFRFEFLRPELI